MLTFDNLFFFAGFQHHCITIWSIFTVLIIAGSLILIMELGVASKWHARTKRTKTSIAFRFTINGKRIVGSSGSCVTGTKAKDTTAKMDKRQGTKRSVKLQKNRTRTQLHLRMTKMTQFSLSQRLNQNLTLDQSVLLRLSLMYLC